MHFKLHQLKLVWAVNLVVENISLKIKTNQIASLVGCDFLESIFYKFPILNRLTTNLLTGLTDGHMHKYQLIL